MDEALQGLNLIILVRCPEGAKRPKVQRGRSGTKWSGEVQKEKILLALEILARFGPYLNEEKSSELITSLLPTIEVLVSSDLEIKESILTDSNLH